MNVNENAANGKPRGAEADNVTLEKVRDFKRKMSQMSEEEQRQFVAQIPDFFELSRQTIDAMERVAHASINANKASQDAFNRQCDEVRKILARQLEGQNISVEERVLLLQMLIWLVEVQYRKDSENKGHIEIIFTMVGAVFLAIAGVVWQLMRKKTGA